MSLTCVEEFDDFDDSESELSEDKPQTKQRRKMKSECYVMETFDSPKAAEKAVKEMKTMKWRIVYFIGSWTPFNIFKRGHYSIWRVKVTAYLNECECTCPFFLKHSMYVNMLLECKFD